MFQELMPLLAQRTLLLTLSRINNEEICVNIIPRPVKAGDKEEINALSTPLSLSGTPLELDQELPQQLVEFVGAHLGLSSTLESAKDEMAAAAKAAKDAARKAAAGKPHSGAAASTSVQTESRKMEPPCQGNTTKAAEETAAKNPVNGTLFESAPSADGAVLPAEQS